MNERVRYYLRATYRRKLLDRLLEDNKGVYRGVVLDVGGRDRGRFVKPRGQVDRWIFADVEERHEPDLVVDVADMKSKVDDRSIDVINAIELFEHVFLVEAALNECARVLRAGGVLVISVPFLYPVHGDPNDYQRWTLEKWHRVLGEAGFEIETEVITGRLFTVMGDMLRRILKMTHPRLIWLAYAVFPLVDMIVALDRLARVQHSAVLGSYHGGYFFVARRLDDSHELTT